MKLEFFLSPVFFLILAIIPLAISVFKFLYSISKKKGLVNSYGKTDIENMQDILENYDLGALERHSLNESLIQAQFKQLYGTPFNKYNRQKAIQSEILSLGKITHRDFRRAKSNILVNGNNIIFHKPPIFSYEAWASVQLFIKYLLIVLSLLIFIFLIYLAFTMAVKDEATVNLEQYLFLIFMFIVYVCLAVFMNQLYFNTKSTNKVKKYLDRTKNMMIRDSLLVLPNLNTIYLISPHSLKFKTVGHKLFCSKIGNPYVYTACHYANYN